MHVKAKDFLGKYSCLAAKDPNPLPSDPKQAVASILRSLNLPETEWQIGKTKVSSLTSHLCSLLITAACIAQCRNTDGRVCWLLSGVL